MQAVRGGCCGRVVLFLWKRDGWGKAVVGTGHPCTLLQQRSFQAGTGTRWTALFAWTIPGCPLLMK